MTFDFDLDRFIREKVTRRERSLLADDFARYDAELHARLDGRRVLVIGGAGSIGSHYIKALLRFDVAKLVVVDISENGLTELVRDLRSAGTYKLPRDFVTYPVNFGDRVFAKLFAAHGPFDIVANFAAHKHVRSEKDVFSIEAMIENNVLRAKGLLDLLVTCPPQHFFCVSTDKAANPVNIMGASKKLMEELIMAYAGRLPIKTARFANVAFSNGSLPLGFLERLFKRQPWSCPLGIRRFFVSPIESGELCLMASIMGESGDIVFPKLDEARDMIPFDQVAVDLLHALGLEPDVCTSEDEAREKMRMRSSLVHYCGSALVGEQEATGNRQSAIGNDSTHALMNSRTNELPNCVSALVGRSEVGAQITNERMNSRTNELPNCGSALVGEQEATGNRQSAIGNDSTHALMNSRTNELPAWPVYFFESDTSGEKKFEEFYTPGEELELERFVNLGVVKNAKRRDLKDIDAIFTSLRALFGQPDVTKAKVVEVLKDYLPNFAHIETGKGLDQKM